MSELQTELETLPKKAQIAAGFITYLSSAPEDERRERIATWTELAGLEHFDMRRFLSTESEQLTWKAEGLPSDDLSMENAVVILQVSDALLWMVLLWKNTLGPRYCNISVSGDCGTFSGSIMQFWEHITSCWIC